LLNERRFSEPRLAAYKGDPTLASVQVLRALL
jgi:hypothetical protein